MSSNTLIEDLSNLNIEEKHSTGEDQLKPEEVKEPVITALTPTSSEEESQHKGDSFSTVSIPPSSEVEEANQTQKPPECPTLKKAIEFDDLVKEKKKTDQFTPHVHVDIRLCGKKLEIKPPKSPQPEELNQRQLYILAKAVKHFFKGEGNFDPRSEEVTRDGYEFWRLPDANNFVATVVQEFDLLHLWDGSRWKITNPDEFFEFEIWFYVIDQVSYEFCLHCTGTEQYIPEGLPKIPTLNVPERGRCSICKKPGHNRTGCMTSPSKTRHQS